MTLATLMRGGPKGTGSTDAREDLRQAQARVKQGRDAAHAAVQAADRGRAAVARAQEAAAVYSGLDEAVATHRADALRAGATASELPRHLVDGRRRQQVAQLELADAERAARLLGNDETATKTALADAEAELLLAVDVVAQHEALRVIERLRERERGAAADRVLISSFLASRSIGLPSPDWTVVSVPMEPINAPLLDIAGRAGLPPGGPAWQGLRTRLMTDPKATLADGG